MSPRRSSTQKVLPRESTSGSVSPEVGSARPPPVGCATSGARRCRSAIYNLQVAQLAVQLEVLAHHAAGAPALQGPRATATAIEAAARDLREPACQVLLVATEVAGD